MEVQAEILRDEGIGVAFSRWSEIALLARMDKVVCFSMILPRTCGNIDEIDKIDSEDNCRFPDTCASEEPESRDPRRGRRRRAQGNRR
jgi:hypothetical protein